MNQPDARSRRSFLKTNFGCGNHVEPRDYWQGICASYFRTNQEEEPMTTVALQENHAVNGHGRNSFV